jgi:hypothetical protein
VRGRRFMKSNVSFQLRSREESHFGQIPDCDKLLY